VTENKIKILHNKEASVPPLVCFALKCCCNSKWVGGI